MLWQALLISAAANPLASSQVVVAKSVILTQPGATAAEIHAAQDLREHLWKITGAEIRVEKDAKEARKNSIVVGQGAIAKKLFPDIQWEKLGEEQTLIKSKGDVLLAAGGRPRGTLYAVYRLLSEKCGVRWWAPWATTIPKDPDLSFSKLDWSETPAFEYRDTFWFHAFDGDWAARNFSNGFSARLDEARGGKIEYQGFVHTYFGLVPPEKHFATHPEWYSLINGKRTYENAQLCTTNPILRDVAVEQVRDWLRSNPKARIVSVSQNDCFNPCQCENCRALSEKEGSDAALVLDLANYVGEKIESEFPNVAVDTLAYQWSRHPTKTMKPRPNVIVRLCSIECNFAYSLDAPQNAAFGDDIRGWSKLTNRLYVWNYCTDFANYMQPHPDTYTIGPTIQFFAKNGVKGVFEEGAYQSNGADLAELKAWVIAQMLWNPKQEPNMLVDEFLRGYYGRAAPFVQRYLVQMWQGAKGWNLTFASPVTASFLDYAAMSTAKATLREAEAAVQNRPELLWRVRQIMSSVDYVWLSRWKEFKERAQLAAQPWPMPESRREAAEAWLATIGAASGSGSSIGQPASWSPVTHVNEGALTPQAFVDMLGPDPAG